MKKSTHFSRLGSLKSMLDSDLSCRITVSGFCFRPGNAGRGALIVDASTCEWLPVIWSILQYLNPLPFVRFGQFLVMLLPPVNQSEKQLTLSGTDIASDFKMSNSTGGKDNSIHIWSYNLFQFDFSIRFQLNSILFHRYHNNVKEKSSIPQENQCFGFQPVFFLQLTVLALSPLTETVRLSSKPVCARNIRIRNMGLSLLRQSLYDGSTGEPDTRYLALK